MPPGGLEPPHMVPETNALSPELWGHVSDNNSLRFAYGDEYFLTQDNNFIFAKLSRKTMGFYRMFAKNRIS